MKDKLTKISFNLKEVKRFLNDEIVKLDNIIDNIEETQEPQEPRWIYNIQVEQISDNELKFTWDTDLENDLEFDIKYNHENEEQWKHSYERYLEEYINIQDKMVKVGFGKKRPDGVWYFKFEKSDDEYELTETLLKKLDGGEDTSQDNPKSEKLITVSKNKKSDLHTPVPNGLIRHNGKYRLYFFERNNDEMLYSESEDLETWSSNKKAEFNVDRESNLLQDKDGQVYLYNAEGDDVYIYEVNGSNLNRLENKRFAYNWRVDGKLTMTIHNGTWYATGRVRGSAPKNEGGWGDDLPEYPKLSEVPYVKQEYDKYLPSYRDPDDFLKDRRGISLHTSNDGKNWSSGKIIADPKNHTDKPFLGWSVKGEDGIGDFYSSLMIDGEKMIVKAYMKEKDRIIDRWDYDPDMSIERRFRFTGETILIPAIYKNGKIEFKGVDSIIPEKYFARKTPDEVEYATCRECVEFGQTSNGNEIIRKDGYVYITFGYRDDVHYEGRDFEYFSGVFIYRIPEEEFDKLFN